MQPRRQLKSEARTVGDGGGAPCRTGQPVATRTVSTARVKFRASAVGCFVARGTRRGRRGTKCGLRTAGPRPDGQSERLEIFKRIQTKSNEFKAFLKKFGQEPGARIKHFAVGHRVAEAQRKGRLKARDFDLSTMKFYELPRSTMKSHDLPTNRGVLEKNCFSHR